MKQLFISFLIMIVGCQNVSKRKPDSPPQYSAKEASSIIDSNQIKLKWDSLCQIKGCLVGGQRVWKGKWGGEGCVFSINKDWVHFLSNVEKKQFAEFLIQQIPNSEKSKIHTCPFDVATKGELAIYCLQGLYLTNFYDLSPIFSKNDSLISKKYKGSEQNWIWHIQKSKPLVDTLQKLWSQKLEHKNLNYTE